MTAVVRETYRHGNVKADAIAAALSILNEKGGDAVSVRAIAQQIGVAHRALYNHFANREGLLAEVAAIGFDRLAVALEQSESRSEFITHYLHFALENAALYMLMMNSGNGTIDRSPALKSVVARVIAASLRHIAPGVADSITARRLVMQVWMRLHGGLALYSGGLLSIHSNDLAFVKEMLRIEAAR
jgi:AcrR family transcriptional regulator